MQKKHPEIKPFLFCAKFSHRLLIFYYKNALSTSLLPKSSLNQNKKSTFLYYKVINQWVSKHFHAFHFRYRPDSVLKSKNNGDSGEVGESELTESESHLNKLNDGETTLYILLHPSQQPTKKSSKVVNMTAGVIGKHVVNTNTLVWIASTEYDYISFVSRLAVFETSCQFFTGLRLLFTVILVCLISALTTHYGQAILEMDLWVLGVLAASIFILVACVILVYRQPQTSTKVSFMVCYFLCLI